MILLETPPANFAMKAEVVSVLPFYNQKVLLLQRLSTHAQANLWCPPGGKIELNETPIHAVLREFREETNLQLTEERLTYLGKYYVRYPNGDFVFFLYKADLTEDEISKVQINPKEHQNFCLYPLSGESKLELSPGIDECLELGALHEVK